MIKRDRSHSAWTMAVAFSVVLGLSGCAQMQEMWDNMFGTGDDEASAPVAQTIVLAELSAEDLR